MNISRPASQSALLAQPAHWPSNLKFWPKERKALLCIPMTLISTRLWNSFSFCHHDHVRAQSSILLRQAYRVKGTKKGKNGQKNVTRSAVRLRSVRAWPWYTSSFLCPVVVSPAGYHSTLCKSSLSKIFFSFCPHF